VCVNASLCAKINFIVNLSSSLPWRISPSIRRCITYMTLVGISQLLCNPKLTIVARERFIGINPRSILRGEVISKQASSCSKAMIGDQITKRGNSFSLTFEPTTVGLSINGIQPATGISPSRAVRGIQQVTLVEVIILLLVASKGPRTPETGVRPVTQAGEARATEPTQQVVTVTEVS
jgi:hypothetical protein